MTRLPGNDPSNRLTPRPGRGPTTPAPTRPPGEQPPPRSPVVEQADAQATRELTQPAIGPLPPWRSVFTYSWRGKIDSETIVFNKICAVKPGSTLLYVYALSSNLTFTVMGGFGIRICPDQINSLEQFNRGHPVFPTATDDDTLDRLAWFSPRDSAGIEPLMLPIPPVTGILTLAAVGTFGAQVQHAFRCAIGQP